MLARNPSQPYRRVSVSQDLAFRVYCVSDGQNQGHSVLCKQGIAGTIHIEATRSISILDPRSGRQVIYRLNIWSPASSIPF